MKAQTHVQAGQLLQALADPIKLILKEDITPARADRYVFTLAPIMSLFQGKHLGCIRGGRTVFANLDFAVIEIGTSWMLSSRLVAVTVISSISWAAPVPATDVSTAAEIDRASKVLRNTTGLLV